MLTVRWASPFWTGIFWFDAGCGMPHRAMAQEATSHEHGYADAERRHPPKNMALHERFYSTWHTPDNSVLSCHNNADCYPTDIRYVDGQDLRKAQGGRKICSDSAVEGGAQLGQSRRASPSSRRRQVSPIQHAIRSIASIREAPT